jgi:hypothetical protein
MTKKKTETKSSKAGLSETITYKHDEFAGVKKWKCPSVRLKAEMEQVQQSRTKLQQSCNQNDNFEIRFSAFVFPKACWQVKQTKHNIYVKLKKTNPHSKN